VPAELGNLSSLTVLHLPRINSQAICRSKCAKVESLSTSARPITISLVQYDKLARIVTEMNKKQIEVEKDAAVMQRKKKMFICIIHCLHSQHCYILFISTEGEKLGYAFYSTVTEFSNCLTILTKLLTIIFSILFDRWLKQRWLKQSL
jgi:hypothetical protein